VKGSVEVGGIFYLDDEQKQNKWKQKMKRVGRRQESVCFVSVPTISGRDGHITLFTHRQRRESV
jgi:hypothetical protein